MLTISFFTENISLELDQALVSDLPDLCNGWWGYLHRDHDIHVFPHALHVCIVENLRW